LSDRKKPGTFHSLSWLGGTYRGELKDNKPDGRGILQRSDGSSYKGEWKGGSPHGRGEVSYRSGALYKGDFIKGKRSGYGIYIYPDGKTIKGLWEEGRLVRPLEEAGKDTGEPLYEKSKQEIMAIKVESLSHWYGKFQAVKDISFEVRPGEILGFLGPNGAGKSTTIKVLTGQLPLKSGDAQILGRRIGRDDPEIQAQIGVTFEEKNLYLEMSALENLDFFASLFGIRSPDSLQALRRVGLAERAKDRVSSYSKGMRQRLMIARAFINRPKVLFLDEPTDGLDPVTAVAIRKTIKEEAARGAAVLLTTHNMFEADELSDRVAFINEGEIVALDTAENLKLKYGKRSVKVRLRDGSGVREEELPLDGEKSSRRLSELAASPDLMTIHTEEATLEAIFIHLTGRGLSG
jgi:ABC-2 type transport system ATP-binding protein